MDESAASITFRFLRIIGIRTLPMDCIGRLFFSSLLNEENIVKVFFSGIDRIMPQEVIFGLLFEPLVLVFVIEQ